MIISSNNTKGQIFNGGSGVSHTNKEITYKIFDMLGDDTEVEFLDTVNNRDSEVWTCDTTKIFNFFGFSCIHSIDNGLLSVKV